MAYTSAGGTTSIAGQTSGSGPQPNPLDKFQTFNSLFTLACLSKNQQNQGNVKKGELENIICRSQGDWEKSKHVKTEFGSFDYFIDDVVIASVPTLGKKNGVTIATKITFKVTEPYSMGLFMLALQQGASAGGYKLNFKEAAFMFMIEFIGYVNDQPSGASPDDQLTRYIPIKFISIKFKVTAAGSVYECEAIPYNEHAYRDQTAKVTTDIKIFGSKVKEILAEGKGSLVNMLKQRHENEKAEQNIKSQDEYDIQFPKSYMEDSGADNEIAQAVLYDKLDAAGTVPFPDLPTVFLDGQKIIKTSALKLETDKNWHFTQSAYIPDVITEVIMRSDYISKQLMQNGQFRTDAMGMVNWFRIEPKIIDGEDNPQLGRHDRKIIYKVLPYKVHVYRFLPPKVKPPGYSAITQSVAREYNYIYTGQNTEVLDVDINFDMAFFTPVPSDASENTAQKNAGQAGLGAGGDDLQFRYPPTAITPYSFGAGKDFSGAGAQFGFGGSASLPGSLLGGGGGYTTNPQAQELLNGTTGNASNDQPEMLAVSQPNAMKEFQYKGQGGAGSDDEKTSQTRSLHRLLLNPGDMVNLNMKIMGDPYYIPSSGMGNQKVSPQGAFSTQDGAMSYQSGQIFVVINFITPIDLDPQSGLYRFEKVVDLWSGLYHIIEIESRFYQGAFTQTLKGVRLRAQLGGVDSKKIFLEPSKNKQGKDPDTSGQGQNNSPSDTGFFKTPEEQQSQSPPGSVDINGATNTNAPNYAAGGQAAGIPQAPSQNVYTDFGSGVLNR